MGRAGRPRVALLGGKLKTIRLRLKLSQRGMAIALQQKQEAAVYAAHISEYERNKREPPLVILLRYARLGRTSTDNLIDDSLELKLPGKD